ncbi:AhpC/TSA family protein [Cellulophaga sp. HaHa_2_95]|uniref:peroxiredoxin-like family protein n=1 Tax=Cellulophaga sp. HaHa_2_95 TaxID=2745558 RepID=UPI001C500639|nr:peroxiredoxin-like family protein [Cellulophaga sp. HaHa_2_95]QXP55350.1 AhpC/TSA family protein [Cellulophaga sp. HaHa_2_95]
MKITKKIRPLEKEINEKKAAFDSSASEDKKQKYAEGIAAVVESNIVGNALQVGETAINFTLPNALGKKITLYDELENGPVILMWYRGGWCPYCNMQLHYMQEMLPEFKKLGASLLAITPETPDNSISTKEKNDLEFEVLSDLDNKVGYEYKVVFKLTEDVKEIYENGFELSKFNGNDKGELPLAATYIIGQNKVIQYAFLDADYRNRAEPQDLLEHLK